MTTGRLERRLERRRVPPLYALADAGALATGDLPDAVVAMARAGIRWIQIRAKRLPDAELFALVDACFQRLSEGSEAGHGDGVSLWMNDRADLAALFPFAGLHLGQRDLPPSAARRVVGPGCWIGASAHDDEELARAAADPDVDVVAVGPVFPTTSKDAPEPAVGLDFVQRARASTAKPVVAIGGIGAASLQRVLAAGADSAALLSAVCRGDVAANARRLVRIVEGGS